MNEYTKQKSRFKKSTVGLLVGALASGFLLTGCPGDMNDDPPPPPPPPPPQEPQQPEDPLPQPPPPPQDQAPGGQ